MHTIVNYPQNNLETDVKNVTKPNVLNNKIYI